MTWSYRRDTRRGDMAHGITFHMWERRAANVRGEAAHLHRKMHLEGVASLTVAENQHKYGDELIAQMYGDDVVVRDRRAESHSRIQVYLGPVDLQTAEMLEAIAAHIRARVKP